MLSVRNNPTLSRYELVERVSDVARNSIAEGAADGTSPETVVGIADYRVEGDRILFPHTVIDSSRRGRGLGAVLVKGALDDVRGSGRRIVPQCWFVAEFIELHAEYADLL
jgi:predicted GNAT family acetyltransferase